MEQPLRPRQPALPHCCITRVALAESCIGGLPRAEAGGCVQLVEREPSYITDEPRAAMRWQEDLFEEMYKQKGFNRRCALDLPAMLESAGFVDIRSERKLTPIGKRWGEDGEKGALAYGGAFRNMGYAAVQIGPGRF